MGWGAHGDIPGFEDRTTVGSRPNGTYLPRFRNLDSRHPDFLRGYGYQGGGGRGGWGRGSSMPGFGASLKNALRTPSPWTYSMSAWGECLPRESNFVALDPVVKDKWGIPALRITCQWGDNERTAMHDAMVQAAEMLEAAGVRNVRQHQADNPPGLTIHEMGTARMGKDPATSVLNGWNQAWEVAQPVRHRWRVHGVMCQPESVDHLHGAHRAGRGSRGEPDAQARAMNRREAVRSLAAGALAPLSSFSSRLPGSWSHLPHLGLQLYTVRALMERNFEGTLAQVARIGYRDVEFAGYFDHTPRQVRDIMRR